MIEPERMERARKLFESVLPRERMERWAELWAGVSADLKANEDGYAALFALHAALKSALSDPSIQAFAPVHGLTRLFLVLLEDLHPSRADDVELRFPRFFVFQGLCIMPPYFADAES
jgi:hypothetical protein